MSNELTEQTHEDAWRGAAGLEIVSEAHKAIGPGIESFPHTETIEDCRLEDRGCGHQGERCMLHVQVRGLEHMLQRFSRDPMLAKMSARDQLTETE